MDDAQTHGAERGQTKVTQSDPACGIWAERANTRRREQSGSCSGCGGWGRGTDCPWVRVLLVPVKAAPLCEDAKVPSGAPVGEWQGAQSSSLSCWKSNKKRTTLSSMTFANSSEMWVPTQIWKEFSKANSGPLAAFGCRLWGTRGSDHRLREDGPSREYLAVHLPSCWL